MSHSASYNDRLFSGSGLRSFFHHARFEWAKKVVGRLDIQSVRMIEIGCFDGRLVDYIPKRIDIYCGYDAGWENGLESGRERFSGKANFRFEKAVDPEPLAEHGDGRFNLGAALETMEHIPPNLVDPYLEELARVIDGYLMISVPNEKGIVFLGKYLAKRLMIGGAEPYSFREIVLATFGRLDRIERTEHKGFDYCRLVRQVERHFEIDRVEGLPFRWLPVGLSFTVGILARSKPKTVCIKAT